MTDVSRRTALALAVGAAAAPLLPEAIAAPVAPAVPLFPAWSVGTPGEYNWKTFFAATKDRAIELYRQAMIDDDGMDEDTAAECDLEANDMKHFEPDTEGEHYMTAQDAYDAGWGHICDRCGVEESPSMWRPVSDKAVCDDCMTLADWQIIDPEHAAELREEMEAEFWDEFSVTLERFFQKAAPSE